MLVHYDAGQILKFVSPGGIPYEIQIEAADDESVTFRNTLPGSSALTLPLDKATRILESPARIDNGAISCQCGIVH